MSASRTHGIALGILLLAALAGCGTTPSHMEHETARTPAPASSPNPNAPPPAPSAKSGGGYYLDDGPGEAIPPNLDQIADATPRDEPLHRYANKSYTVMGRNYVPIAARQPFRQRGVASWYGKRFHGKKTSSGELYDMYAMSAAHPTLPIPSYVRVVNVSNGRSVVVRVNDRGPFLHDRIIDLSYAAAHRLDYIQRGHTLVEIEVVLPPLDNEVTALSEAPPPASAFNRSEGPNHYLQLGAFSSRDNAESLKTRVADQAGEYAAALSIVPSDGLFRVQLGPYKNRGEASSIGEQLRSLLDLQPHLVTR